MNKSESKYFNTALLMDEALISLLAVKDLEYITIKEICKKAGVNRSTFYLHYDTVADLANEALETVNRRFLSYFDQNAKIISDNISEKEPKDLIFITQDYLKPYLQFIYDNKNVYRAAFCSPNGMQANTRFRYLKEHILTPILSKFEIPESVHKYYIAYYIQGITAIIKVWLNSDCTDAVDTISDLIEQCVRPLYDSKDC